jgi:hypothetical protein
MVTLTDLKEALKGLIFESQIREAQLLNYLGRMNVHAHPDRNAQLIYRVYRTVGGITEAVWGDARKAINNDQSRLLVFDSFDAGNMLLSKKCFAYPSLGARLKIVLCYIMVEKSQAHFMVG